MHGEKHGHECAGPRRAGGGAEECEEEHRGKRVKEDIGEMVSARPQTEDLHIEQVRKARRGKPIRGLGAGNRPDDAVHGKAVAHVRVVGDVVRIVEVDEAETVNRRIDQ